ncbi:sulfurtransferase TusA family protein [Cohnella zeiphila]|uniref:Sulfurtransferase TusA family protein n=1 Tax=Cohnella zeiphila TaxID=2761120 RepID=A0A7X0VZH5_9BACL|nr:sulfurtransferase TusA family protein [Cohnella zeiphila]MBB6735577.1 sulfurtransferase TusA family protein [Cohnella zeiphila]
MDVHGLTPDRQLDLGDIPAGPDLFLLVRNALQRTEQGQILELISTVPQIKNDLQSWCRLHRHRFLMALDGGDHYRFLIRSGTAALDKPDWGIRLPLRKGGKLDIRDWFEGRVGELREHASSYVGFVPRGAVAEPGIPDFGFTLNRKDDVWSDNLLDLYEQAKAGQWNATEDIDWEALPQLPEDLEWAVCQIMTFLAENEYSALYIPAKFMARINPHYIEALMYLSTLIQDESRHIEAFTKRALAGGGGLQYSSTLTERSLHSLFIQEDYFKSSFLLHVLGEGTFLDLLTFIEQHSPDPVTRQVVTLAKIDEGRHVAYGIGHVRHILQQHPGMAKALVEAADERNEYLNGADAGDNSHVMEALAILAGGGRDPGRLKAGFIQVGKLKTVMYEHRVQRLLQIGLDRETAEAISKSHTPNFM